VSTTTLPSRARDWRELLQLAWPMLIGQLAQVGMGVTDTIMAGAVSPVDLAAVAVGFSLWLPLSLLGNGIFTAVTALIARAHGGGRSDQVAMIFQQALWLALLVGAVSTTLVINSSALLEPMAVDAAVRPLAAQYLQGIALGIPAATLIQVLRGFSEGCGRSKPVMIISLGALLINIPLNYVFIHGLFGAPRLGGAGCGWATGVTLWLQLLALAALLYPRYRPCLRRWSRPLWPQQRTILQLGFPIGAAIFAEVSIFALVALLIGHLGAATIASHQIALNFSGLVFMVPFSLGVALTVKVGHALGAGQAVRARRFAALGALTAATCSGISALVMLLLPGPIVALYSDDPGVSALTVQLLAVAAAFQLSDALQVTAAGSLRGYHDTRATMLITLLAYWGIGLPSGYLLGLTDRVVPALGVQGLWIGLVLGLTVAALLLNWRLLRISRRHNKAESAANAGRIPGNWDPDAG
jgi:MATE family multidrug resistance protein